MDKEEKKIEDLLKKISIPDIKESDSTEEIILKYINLVKEVEKRRGLSDKEIIAKYTNGKCGYLSDGIKNLLKFMQKKCLTNKIDCKIPNSPHNGKHEFITTFKPGSDIFNVNDRLNYDILGKHTHEEMVEFSNHFYLEHPEYTEIAHEMTKEQLYEWVPNLLTEFIINHIENEKRINEHLKKVENIIEERTYLKNELNTLFYEKINSETRSKDEIIECYKNAPIFLKTGSREQIVNDFINTEINKKSNDFYQLIFDFFDIISYCDSKKDLEEVNTFFKELSIKSNFAKLFYDIFSSYISPISVGILNEVKKNNEYKSFEVLRKNSIYDDSVILMLLELEKNFGKENTFENNILDNDIISFDFFYQKVNIKFNEFNSKTLYNEEELRFMIEDYLHLQSRLKEIKNKINNKKYSEYDNDISKKIKWLRTLSIGIEDLKKQWRR